MPEWPFVEYRTLSSSERSSFSMGPFGSKITKENYIAAGVPVVRGVNLARGIFVDDDFVFISQEKADELIAANVAPGDLLFTHRGTIGQVSMLPRKPRFNRYVIGSSQVKTRLDESVAVPEYYYYWFMSPEGQRSILANTSTVGVPGIATPLTSIKGLRVPLPPLSTQRAVADLLGALDDKIAVNDRIAGTMDELSTALFEEATSQCPQISLSETATPVLGSTPDRTVSRYWGGAVPWASAKDVANSSFGVVVTTEEQITEDAAQATRAKPAPPGSVVLTARGTVGAVARVINPTSLNQSCYAFIPGQIPSGVLFHLVRTASDRMLSIAHGTVFSTVNMKTFNHIVVPAITDAQLPALEGKLAPFHRGIEQLLLESMTLRSLRDALLPGLMSGRLRVKDAENVVEEAV